MRMIKLTDGSTVTAEQFRTQNSNVQYSGEFPSSSYLETIGASIVEVVITLTTEAMAANVREERDALIAATDFYALSDVVMTAEMTTYRQALRDISSQAGFPNTIIWPTAP